MDSNQSAKKNFDVMNSFQNQDDDNVPELMEVDGSNIESFQENLHPLRIGSEKSLQNQDDDNVPELMEVDDSNIESFQENLDPLRIGSILEKIFSNLDVNSIKNARQVNPLWSIEGAKMLITKCFLKIPSNLQVEEKSSNSKEMDEFKAFLSHKSSDHSMIRQIVVDKVGDVKSWKSLGVLGPQIESLKLNFGITDLLENNPVDLLPNLKYLYCEGSVKDPFWKENGFIKVVNSVITSSEEDRSPLVISYVPMEVGVLKHQEQLENLEKFADCSNIMIDQLECTLYIFPLYMDCAEVGIRVSNLMGKLLSRSRNVLKSLILKNCAWYLPLLEFPRMPALTNLELVSAGEDHNPLQPYKFSPSFRFSENLPNLNYFRLQLSFEPEPRPSLFLHLLEETGTANSVKILEFHQDFWERDIDKLLKTFPNIEVYWTFCLSASPKMFESIWKYAGNLRKLEIKVGHECGPHLDSFITGFTPETVDKIKETPNLDPYTLEEMEQLRVNPSILNLKDLEHLELCFMYKGQSNAMERFLAVSGEYAFKLLPKVSKILLEVRLQWPAPKDGGNFLDEVSKLPNVTVLFNLQEWFDRDAYKKRMVDSNSNRND